MSQQEMKKRVLAARSEVGNATRTKDRDPDRLVKARLAFNAVKIEQAIESYAPISKEARAGLALVLLVNFGDGQEIIDEETINRIAVAAGIEPTR